MASSRFLDSKRLHRLLFGVYFQEDICERVCDAAPLLAHAFRTRALAAARTRNLIFLHVPRAAGTSISRALFGERCIRHYSARCLRAMAPKFWNSAESFAILRDPFDRFASAYAFVRAGGTSICRLNDAFLEETAHIRSVDDYLCFIEERAIMELDFVMRPQHWFLCDLENGLPLVKRLFQYGRDEAALLNYLRPYGIGSLPWLNRSIRIPLTLSRRQKLRIEKVYEADFALLDLIAGQNAYSMAAE